MVDDWTATFWRGSDCLAMRLSGAAHCQFWVRAPLTAGRMKGFAVRRARRLASVVRRGVWTALRHPAVVPRWCLPYWFLRRREGDVYANAFMRLPSRLRSGIPAGFMRLWSEHVASSAERE